MHSAAVKQRFCRWEGHLGVMYTNVYNFTHSLIGVHSQTPSLVCCSILFLNLYCFYFVHLMLLLLSFYLYYVMYF